MRLAGERPGDGAGSARREITPLIREVQECPAGRGTPQQEVGDFVAALFPLSARGRTGTVTGHPADRHSEGTHVTDYVTNVTEELLVR